jgi:hypothetical protein
VLRSSAEADFGRKSDRSTAFSLGAPEAMGGWGGAHPQSFDVSADACSHERASVRGIRLISFQCKQIKKYASHSVHLRTSEIRSIPLRMAESHNHL